MAFDWKLWFDYKHKHLVAQFLLATLFVGLAFRLVLFRSSGFNPDLEASTIVRSKVSPEPPSDSAAASVNVSEAKDRVAQPPVSVAVPDVGDRIRRPIAPLGGPENEDQVAKPPVGDQVAEPPVAGSEDQTSRGDSITDKCDLFAGDWVPDLTGPFYTNETCLLIEGHQNCMRNGRPDTGYLYWRWNPRNCELPRFDPQRFLDLMRNKTWALVGDSISRNHVQSLLCILSTVEQAIEVYHDEGYKSKRWYFPSHNFTVSVIWSPFLVEATIFEDDNGVSTSEVELHLDKLDKNWTHQYQTFDYTIISTGKWFLKNSIYHENNTILGCHNCDSRRNLTELGYDFAYRKALTTVLTFVSTTKHKGLVMFRTSTPDHFEGKEWHNGGQCPKTGPVKDGEVELRDLDRYLRDIELEEFEKALAMAAENGVDLRLLDLMKLSLLRPDGHPGPYRKFQPFDKDLSKNSTVQNDCLHWCLPGPIDSWNDVIMEMILSG